MCRKELALICILIQEANVKKSFSTHFKYLQLFHVEQTSSCLITAVKQLWADTHHRTIFSDYWLCKIPYKEISSLYLLYGVSPETLSLKIDLEGFSIRRRAFVSPFFWGSIFNKTSYKIVVYIGSTTSRDSNQPPPYWHCDVLPT